MRRSQCCLRLRSEITEARTQRFLMRAYAATGNRARAVAEYHEFRELLANEMGTDPEPETQALYLKILD